MATRRLSALVHGQENEAYDPTLGNEAQLAKMGYKQGRHNLPHWIMIIPTNYGQSLDVPSASLA
jgi:hypothetical protein